VTGDKSQFLQHYNHQQIWFVSAEEVLTKVASTMAAPKTMLTVFLSIHSAIFIDWLPPWEEFNSGYFCEKRPEPLFQVLLSGCGAGSPRSILHFDNAAPHRSAVIENCFQSCQFRHALQLPYGPDISLSGFFLFGDLKPKLKAEELGSMGELHDVVKELLGQVISETIQRVSEHGIGKLNQVIYIGVDYVSSQLS
jgi:hypothetical protein